MPPSTAWSHKLVSGGLLKQRFLFQDHFSRCSTLASGSLATGGDGGEGRRERGHATDGDVSRLPQHPPRRPEEVSGVGQLLVDCCAAPECEAGASKVSVVASFMLTVVMSSAMKYYPLNTF